MNGQGEQPAVARGPLAFPPLPVAWLLVSAVVVVLDLHTKQLAAEALELYRPQAVFSWLNMTLAHNYGAAFSFLSSAGGWQRWFFIVLASVVSVVLLVWLLRLPRKPRRPGAPRIRDRLHRRALPRLALSRVQCRRFGDHLRRRAADHRRLRDRPEKQGR